MTDLLVYQLIESDEQQMVVRATVAYRAEAERRARKDFERLKEGETDDKV